jgi:hypothetical protein
MRLSFLIVARHFLLLASHDTPLNPEELSDLMPELEALLDLFPVLRVRLKMAIREQFA